MCKSEHRAVSSFTDLPAFQQAGALWEPESLSATIEASVFQNSSACRGKGPMILGRVLRAPHMRSARENEDRP